MASPPEHRPHLSRVLLKISGEAFCAPGNFGVDPEELKLIAAQIGDAHSTGAQVAVVVGGGNIIRGARLAEGGLVHQANADYMGMLGTVINGIALRECLTKLGVEARCMTALHIPSVAEPFIRLRALRHLDKGRVVVLAGGTGNPFCTTDSAAALRAIELGCQAILKATKVDGVYTADPVTNPNARRFETLTFQRALNDRLGVMDLQALVTCQEHDVPVIVFDFKIPGNTRKVIEGATSVGTLISTP